MDARGILRIMTDPLLTSTKNNKKYKDIIGCTLSLVQLFLAHSNRPFILNHLFCKNLVMSCAVNVCDLKSACYRLLSQGLLQFILQSFFECAQVNSCVFAELWSSQTPRVLSASLTDQPTSLCSLFIVYLLRLFRKEQQKGEIEWRDCILMFAPRNL